MKQRAAFTFLLILTCNTIFAQAMLPDARLHALVLQGIDLTWREEYDSANSVFQNIVREFPEHPSGYLYQAGVLLSRAMDNEMEVNVAQFDSLLDVGKRKAEEMLKIPSEEAWGRFFLGTADGSDSYARVYRGDWFGGTREGFSSVSSFKDALELDTTLSDACAGIGAFYYWRSRKTESFNWLPFLGDDREEAFRLLRKTVEKGIYNKFTALNMLDAIYIDAGLYGEAAACSTEGLKQYTRSRTFLWGLATASQKSGKWESALSAYQRLLAVIVSSKDNNHYNEIVCMLNLAKVKIELREPSEARELLKSITKFHKADFPKHLQERTADKVEQAEKMLARMTETPSAVGN